MKPLTLSCIDIGLQSLLYLISSLLLEFTAFSEEDLFIVYSILTFLCVVLVSMYLVKLPLSGAIGGDEASSLEHVKSVIVMTLTDQRAITIAPMAVTFGFISVFTASVNKTHLLYHLPHTQPSLSLQYINDKVVSDYIGTYSVGYLGVIQTVSH